MGSDDSTRNGGGDSQPPRAGTPYAQPFAPQPVPPAAPLPPQTPAGQNNPPQYPQYPQYPQPAPQYPAPPAGPGPQPYPAYPAAPPNYAPRPAPPQPQPVRPVTPVQAAPQVQPAQPVQPQPVPAQPAQPQPVPVQQGQPRSQAALAPGGKAAERPRPILATKPSLPRETPEDEEEDGGFGDLFRKSPPWLVSAIFHMVLLIVLGLIAFAVKETSQVELVVSITDEVGEQLEDFTFNTEQVDEQVEEELITPTDLPPVPDPFAAPAPSEIAIDPNTMMSQVEAPTVGLALSGREAGMKQALLAAYGGDGTTESAVKEGLAWLARNQQRDGSWSLSGPYDGGAINDNKEAATAMALLAFQGAGHTHRNGEYSRQVARGWNWLIEQQDENGNFFDGGVANHRLYTQAQCTIALCELYGMTRDPKFKEPAQRAIQYAIDVQDPELGGWRYFPRQGSDTSVTGWFVMALQSAKMAYLPVPEKTFDRIRAYLDKVQINDGAQYLYQPNSHGGDAMDAEGLLCRQYLGWRQNDPRLVRGAKLLVANPIDWNARDAYYWYYATQVCHHMEGDIWRQWNAQMKKVIPAHQIRGGDERGSWEPRGEGSVGFAHGGRLYITCLHLYMLEVYYRHLPIYQYHNFFGAGS